MKYLWLYLVQVSPGRQRKCSRAEVPVSGVPCHAAGSKRGARQTVRAGQGYTAKVCTLPALYCPHFVGSCHQSQIQLIYIETQQYKWDLFFSILGCVLPLQEVSLCQSPPSFSVLCYPHPYRSLLPQNVISPKTFWSSCWYYILCLPLCASNSPSIIFHLGDVSSPFPFRIGYVLDYVCHSDSLLNEISFLNLRFLL